MCKECVKTKLPERGTMCLETGSYFLNFKGCKECGNMLISNIDIEKEDTDSTESVKFTHVCEHCGHQIAKHEVKEQKRAERKKLIRSLLSN
jgi:hypothetical protein